MLQTYGIPTHCLRPIDEVVHHLQWLKSLQEQELRAQCVLSPAANTSAITQSGGESCYPKGTILVPRRFDVVFGKGKYASEHTGNLRAFHIVQMNRQAYEKASKNDKKLLAEKIVKLIKGSYGRFLKRQTKGFKGPWVEVDHETAREKISHYFRRMREIEVKQEKEEKKVQQQQEKLSSFSVSAKGSNKRPTTAATSKVRSVALSGNSLEATPEGDEAQSLKKRPSVVRECAPE